jgi:hypothetical protein
MKQARNEYDRTVKKEMKKEVRADAREMERAIDTA